MGFRAVGPFKGSLRFRDKGLGIWGFVGFGFGVSGLGFCGFRVWGFSGLGFCWSRVWGFWFGVLLVLGLGVCWFRDKGLGVWGFVGLGIRVYGFGVVLV